MKLIVIILFILSIIFWFIGLMSTTIREFALFFIKKNKSRLKLTIVYLIGLPIFLFIILMLLNNDKFEELVSSEKNNILEKKQSRDSKEKELNELSGEELFDELMTNNKLNNSVNADSIQTEKVRKIMDRGNLDEIIKNSDSVFNELKHGKLGQEIRAKEKLNMKKQGIPYSFRTCKGCHGPRGDLKALGKSKILTNMTTTNIIKALNGYKNNTYGGSLKGLMKGQVKSLSNQDIIDIANALGKSAKNN